MATATSTTVRAAATSSAAAASSSAVVANNYTMAVCANRPDGGFGWYKGSMTTCTEDTLLSALPGILLICSCLICFALKKRMPMESRSAYAPSYGLQRLDSKASYQSSTPINLSGPTTRKRMTVAHIGILLITAAVWMAAFTMHVVEIVRLSKGWLGIGLLYICFPPLALAIITLFVPTHATNAIPRQPRPHSWAWSISLVAWSLAMCIIYGIKVNTLVNVGASAGTKVDSATAKNPDTYYNDSRKLDSIAILICYAVAIPFYCVLTWVDRRRAALA